MSDTIEVKFKPKYFTAKKILPLILALVVIFLDQASKIFVSKNIPFFREDPRFLNPEYYQEMMSNFINFVYVNNPGIAFSIGQGWGDNARAILFRLVPLIVLIVVLGIYMRNNDFSVLQRISISGIVGGGFGNLIDRFFRNFPLERRGVIDFIDVKWFGIEKSPFKFLRWERWPTFNIADAAVVVCGILLIISFLISMKNSKNAAGDE